MSADSTVSHAELGAVLTELRVGVGASDLHGSLAGYLCAGGHASAADWLDRLALETDAAGSRPALLDRLFGECRAQLEDPDLGFQPLLPDEDRPLPERAEELVEWCRGFLGGMGLAGVAQGHALSEDGAEILRDFGTIAGSHFELDDAEEDENALSEVVEFIRIGVLLLHGELNAAPLRKTLH